MDAGGEICRLFFDGDIRVPVFSLRNKDGVRDSFTIPKDEYAVLDTLKDRATALAHPVMKSELLRAGLKVLAGLSDSALRSALEAVPSIKTGRPKADAAEPAPTTPAKPATKASGKADRK